jgi:riboflavin kinase/FMN adenylyltransferase
LSEFTREELRHFRAGRATALTIGNFDGVHRGHQHLVRYVIDRAREVGMASAVVTLYPDPDQVLRPQQPMRYLSSLEERVQLLRGLGLDTVIPLSFTSELASLSARSFAALLRIEVDMRLLIMGPDNGFGRNREGTPARMEQLGAQLGFQCEVLPQAVLDAGKQVSATAIRTALAEGDLETVERQLGRRFSLRGPVVKGEQRGRTIGFPTANISLTADRALPALGVYATWAYVGDKRYPAATNIGKRPTFAGDHVTVETHIIDFDGDLYDEQLRIELVACMRPEMKFGGIEELKSQIARDVEDARRVLANAE